MTYDENCCYRGCENCDTWNGNKKVKSTCAHCKKSFDHKELKLVDQNNISFYACPKCYSFFNKLKQVLIEDDSLLRKLGGE